MLQKIGIYNIIIPSLLRTTASPEKRAKRTKVTRTENTAMAT